MLKNLAPLLLIIFYNPISADGQPFLESQLMAAAQAVADGQEKEGSLAGYEKVG